MPVPVSASAQCVVGALHPVCEVFLATLSPSRDPDLRIAMLALLDSFFSSQSSSGGGPSAPSSAGAMSDDPGAGGAAAGGPQYSVPGSALGPYLPSLIVNGLGPNMEWRVGRVAATIRKVAIACLFAALRRGALDEGGVQGVARATLPTLKSCLGDDDAATRHVTCLVLSRLFKSLPGCVPACVCMWLFR